MNADSSDIHRLLDEAFAGVTITPELQDLKEELRGNLAARSAELQAKGADAASAARTAVAELGSIPELIAAVGGEAGTPLPPGAAAAEAARLHRVKPQPGFVVRATLLSLFIAVSAVFIALFALDLLGNGVNAGAAASIVFGLAIASLVTASLVQETAQRYRMRGVRAFGYGLAAGALGTALGLGALFAGHLALGGLLAWAIVLTLASLVTFIALGVTQTNRMKPWALAQQRGYEVEDRFSQDPVAAARFGIYTVIIWIVAIALFVVLSIAVGFVWSWLALVGGVVVFFLVLTRMLFTPTK
ncbi:MAG: hypothetical protein JF618_01760 [Leifsonia sp.]|nr:hypothetical protein [Leifsonia sp.]